jgi:hypothetical protein
VALAIAAITFGLAGSTRADESDKKTIITFRKAVEIPGRVLPAGTYVFKLTDSLGDRHIVQVFTADGSQILATLLAIPDSRLTTTDATFITFDEGVAGDPDAIRAWFYPGNSIGQEFVYPMSRAIQLAAAAKAVVPAIAVDVDDVSTLKTAPILAVTPAAPEVPIADAIQPPPLQTLASSATAPTSGSSVAGAPGVMRTGGADRQLPQTASNLPLLVVMGLGSIGVAFGLMMFGKRTLDSVR